MKPWEVGTVIPMGRASGVIISNAIRVERSRRLWCWPAERCGNPGP